MADNVSDPESFTVSPEDAGARLDQYLSDRIGSLSRTRVKALIKESQARIGGRTIEEPNHRVNAGEVISLNVPPPEDPVPKGEDIPLDILFEDDHLIVINKPAGLVVHPAAGNWTGTLVNALIAHCGDSLSGIGGVRRPGIVHRLDKDTSGVMVVAKTDEAHKGLSEQFADHGRAGDLRRAYSALCWGVPSPRSDTINATLGRSSQNRLKRAVVKDTHPDAREAITHYRVKQVAGEGKSAVSLVECRLETGRTHQIRVHLAHIGHPLLGDPLYGTGFKTRETSLSHEAQNALKKLERQALHAHLLAFKHPKSGKLCEFEADLPADLANLLEKLNQSGA